MRLQEVVLCATAPHSSASGTGSIFLSDIQNTTTLASFKQTNAENHCTAVLESTGTQGGFILAAQPEKSILNVYNFQKDQVALKIVLPEKLSCIAIDRKGQFCAGGTAQGRMYLWEVASGILFNSWDAHYRRINVLRFTNDGTVLISGSDDSAVSVWLTSRLVDNETQNDLPTSHHTLSDHTLPVTDIQCGVGASLNCRILTSSVDHSVKLWDLSSATLLTTFQFPQVITHIAWDATERVFFAAAPDGSIHRANLFQQRKDDMGEHIMEAVGGGGASDIVRLGGQDENPQKRRPISVGESISSMAISLTSTFLLVGTSNGAVQVYDLPSHQLLRTISTHTGFSITYITSFLKPPDLVGHISLDLKLGSMSDAKDALPAKPVHPFQRMKDPKTREAHEITMLLHPKSNPYQDDTAEYTEKELLRDHAFFVGPVLSQDGAINSGIDSASTKNRIVELETEVMQLKEQLGKAKSINDAMWDTVVHRLIDNDSEQGVNEIEKGESGLDSRRNKRSRGV